MNRITRILIFLTLFLTMGTQFVSGEPMGEGSISFTIDGKTISFSEAQGIPYINEGGRTMMPLRACLNAIGCQVNWKQESQTVTLNKGDVQVEIPVGRMEIYKNGTPVPLDAAAIIKNGRTYLPLRSVLEAYGYAVDWDNKTKTVMAFELTPSFINGGTTGIFSRTQLLFEGFDGIEADITLPVVTLADKGDCPYVYFGFDWKNDVGNVEGGFQFIEDPNHPGYNKWTAFMRQGSDWRWGNNIQLEQGATHHMKFYCDSTKEGSSELVIELDGKEIIRKASTVSDFSTASAKAVTAMAMLRKFDGTNCNSKSLDSKISNLKVSSVKSDEYVDFHLFKKYQEWKPKVQGGGIRYGTVDCIPSYLHYKADGSISIYSVL